MNLEPKAKKTGVYPLVKEALGHMEKFAQEVNVDFISGLKKDPNNEGKPATAEGILNVILKNRDEILSTTSTKKIFVDKNPISSN